MEFLMLEWFEKQAPIRVKLASLTWLLAGFSLLGVLGAALGSAGWVPNWAGVALALLGLACTVVAMRVASDAIATPYVSIVVRIEAMAAGDHTSEIPIPTIAIVWGDWPAPALRCATGAMRWTFRPKRRPRWPIHYAPASSSSPRTIWIARSPIPCLPSMRSCARISTPPSRR
jgi:hypothetical protein